MDSNTRGQWGRFDASIGAPVDDSTRTVFAKGLGWVNAKGDVYSGGQWFPSTGHAGESQGQAQQWAEKARRVFEGGPGAGQGMSLPKADLMPRPRPAPVPAPAPGPMSAPGLPNPSHELIAKSFTTLAKALTGGGT